MGEIKPFKKHKLVIAVLSVLHDRTAEIVNALTDEFGPADFRSREIPFTYTEYYNREMGSDIERFFLSFKKLISPDELSEVKIHTNYLEKFFSIQDSEGNSRRVNFDPGILNLSHLILASTKDNVHRIPLNGGIYGEVTLGYKDGAFTPYPWTYIDYRSPEYSEILSVIRDIYKADISGLST